MGSNNNRCQAPRVCRLTKKMFVRVAYRCPKKLKLNIQCLYYIIGGLADRTGAIHVGDRLLAINGADLSEAPLSTAIAQLQNTDDRVVITVSRPQQRSFYTSVGLLSTAADDSAIESDTTRSAPNLHEPTPERIVLRHRSKSAQRKVPEFDSDYFGGTLRPYYIREHADYDIDSIFKIAESQDRDGLLDFDLFQVRRRRLVKCIIIK